MKIKKLTLIQTNANNLNGLTYKESKFSCINLLIYVICVVIFNNSINFYYRFCELSGTTREVDQLKGAWRRLRITAKKRVGDHKRALNATGGGQKPPSPTDEDRKIMNICPTDFIIEENIFDSDGFFKDHVSYFSHFCQPALSKCLIISFHFFCSWRIKNRKRKIV